MNGDITEKEYIEALEKALKDIHDMHSFDWPSMPEPIKRDIRATTVELADEVLKLRWKLPRPRPSWAVQDIESTGGPL